MPTIRIRDLDMYYEQVGSGPPLVLIAGIPMTARNWRPFAALLADQFRVIAFDNRGSGESDKPPHGHTIAQYAEDAKGLIEALEMQRPHVFGVSMGGMIAQELALRAGPQLARVVLGCTHCGGRHIAPLSRDVRAAFADEGHDWDQRMATLARFAFAPGVQVRRRHFYAAFVQTKCNEPQTVADYERQRGAAARHDTCARLAHIDNPTLVITGAQDQVIPATHSGLLHAHIPRSRHHVIENAGHLFFLEQAQQTAAAVRAFLCEEP